MASVALRNLRKEFPGKVVAVRDINLDIRDKEFLVLVGPSGCGKSTALRMIAGLEAVTAGEILIDGVRVNDTPPKDRDIAMVFQNYALYPHMTVFKNMAFGLMLRKLPKHEIKQRVHEAAEILDITELLERKPKALSGGQRQRVAVGRAIVRQPKVFLFDEPLSNLDAKLRVQMRVELQRLHQHLRTTMIYVTHDQTEAMTMGDRIVVMRRGEILQNAPPLEIYHHPRDRFVAEFIGSPPMNIIEGTLFRQNGTPVFQDAGKGFELAVPEPAAARLENFMGKSVHLGIRPEHLRENPAQTHIPKRTLQATVKVVEPMGADVMLYVEAGGQPLTARIQSPNPPESGAAYVLDVALEKLHFFDGQTLRAIH